MLWRWDFRLQEFVGGTKRRVAVAISLQFLITYYFFFHEIFFNRVILWLGAWSELYIDFNLSLFSTVLVISIGSLWTFFVMKNLPISLVIYWKSVFSFDCENIKMATDLSLDWETTANHGNGRLLANPPALPAQGGRVRLLGIGQ